MADDDAAAAAASAAAAAASAQAAASGYPGMTQAQLLATSAQTRVAAEAAAAELEGKLSEFWAEQLAEVQAASEFKNHLLPLARIKKIMKSDEDVRMISAEAPVLFAKACEMFILELTYRAWAQTEDAKRRTLQRSDISTAIQKTDIFDFLIDIVPREEAKKDAAAAPALDPAHLQAFYASAAASAPAPAPPPYQAAAPDAYPQHALYNQYAYQQAQAQAQAAMANPNFLRMQQQMMYHTAQGGGAGAPNVHGVQGVQGGAFPGAQYPQAPGVPQHAPGGAPGAPYAPPPGPGEAPPAQQQAPPAE